MPLPTVDGAFYPTETEVRDQLLRTIRLAYLRRGRTVNVLPGSDYFITCTAMARVVVVAFANSKVALRHVSPLTATGDNLTLLAKAFGVDRRPPSSASGYLVVVCTGVVVIPSGYGCTAPNGKKYATTAAGTFTSGQVVAVLATDAGADTNQEAGTLVSWDSAAVGALASTATVGPGAISGGAEGDDDETLRERLILRLSFPGAGGNWAQLKGWAEDASAGVAAAYVYSAVRGPGSDDIALIRPAGDRSLSQTFVAGVSAKVAANLPGHVSLNATTVQPQLVDVTVAAKLPLPTLAGGAGGGWRDAVPWPSDDAQITAVNGTTLTVATAGTPMLGAQIGLWDPTGQAMTEFAVSSVPVPVTGGVQFSIAPIAGGVMPPWVTVGMYFSAGAVNLATYAADLAAQMFKLGPGEKTVSPDILPRALRKPSPDVVGPTDLTSLLLAAVTTSHPEILSFEWGVRRLTGTPIPCTSPPIPLTTAEPPFVLVLKHLAIRKG